MLLFGFPRFVKHTGVWKKMVGRIKCGALCKRQIKYRECEVLHFSQPCGSPRPVPGELYFTFIGHIIAQAAVVGFTTRGLGFSARAVLVRCRWTKWHLGKLLPRISTLPCRFLFYHCLILIPVHNQGIVPWNHFTLHYQWAQIANLYNNKV
jgi:hypothetical protein